MASHKSVFSVILLAGFIGLAARTSSHAVQTAAGVSLSPATSGIAATSSCRLLQRA